MRRFSMCWMLLAACMMAAPVFAQELPEAIKELAPVFEQPGPFVDGVRTWGKAKVLEAESNLEEAKQLARSRKPDEAKAKKKSAEAAVDSVREVYEFALKKYTNDAKLHNSYGELLYDQFGENAGALREWNLAISLDAKYAPPYNNLGLDQCHSGSYEMGIANLEKALDLDPKNPDFMFNIAQIYLVNFPQIEKIKKWKPKKIYERAMKLSKEATELQPGDYQLAEDYALNFFAAENFKLEADWPEAAAAWARARTVATRTDRQILTLMNEARCWIQAQQQERARPCLEEVLKLDPNSAVAKNLLENLGKIPVDESKKESGNKGKKTPHGKK